MLKQKIDQLVNQHPDTVKKIAENLPNYLLAIILFFVAELGGGFALQAIEPKNHQILPTLSCLIIIMLGLTIWLVKVIHFDDFNHIEHFKQILPDIYWGLGMVVWSVIINLMHIQSAKILHIKMLMSNNQDSISMYLKQTNGNWVKIISLGLFLIIFAPIAEEALYRLLLIGNVRNQKQKVIVCRIITSIILFIAPHVGWLPMNNHLSGWFNWIWLIITYLPITLVLTYRYVKTNNFHHDILTHMTYNLILLI